MSVQWLAPQTKQAALQKLAATDVQVDIRSLEGLFTRSRPARCLLEHAAAARRFNVNEERQQVGKPTPRDFWLPRRRRHPPTAISSWSSTKCFAGRPLQPPFFNPDATDAVNYGAFGITVAHDLTHFIEAWGCQRPAGHPTNWWTDADRQQFKHAVNAWSIIRWLFHRAGCAP